MEQEFNTGTPSEPRYWEHCGERVFQCRLAVVLAPVYLTAVQEQINENSQIAGF